MGLHKKTNLFSFQSALCRMVSLLEKQKFDYPPQVVLEAKITWFSISQTSHVRSSDRSDVSGVSTRRFPCHAPLEFPVILRLILCDLLSRSAHLHLTNFTFLEVSQIWQPHHVLNPLLKTYNPTAPQAVTEIPGRRQSKYCCTSRREWF